MQFEPYIAVLSAIVITTGDRGQIDFPLSGMMSQNAVYLPPSRGGKRRERERREEGKTREREGGGGGGRGPDYDYDYSFRFRG